MAIAPRHGPERVIRPGQRLLKSNPGLNLLDRGRVLDSLQVLQIVASGDELNDLSSFAFLREISVKTVREYSKQIRIEIRNLRGAEFVHRPQRGGEGVFPTFGRNALRIKGKTWRFGDSACGCGKSSRPQTT